LAGWDGIAWLLAHFNITIVIDRSSARNVIPEEKLKPEREKKEIELENRKRKSATNDLQPPSFEKTLKND
jgi:hypothetical protein